MKKIIIGIGMLLLLYIIAGKLFNRYVYNNFPDGNDVANAISIQDKISNLLSTGLQKSEPGNNIVMMAERKNGFAVGIRNPSPSIESVFDIIANNRESIVGNDLIISFYDSKMNLLEERKISDELSPRQPTK